MDRQIIHIDIQTDGSIYKQTKFRQTDLYTDRQNLDRRIYIQTYKQKDRLIDREADRQTDRQIDRQADRQTYKQTDRQINRQMDRQIDIQIFRQTDLYTDKIQTDGSICRQTNRKID